MSRPATPGSSSGPARGGLLGTRLSILAAEMSDPDRFRRGRAYQRQGAVVRVDVEPLCLSGWVQGSRSVPYQVTWRTRAWHAGEGVMPDRERVSASCTCPDGVGVCKHAVAVLLAFADQVGAQPGLLYDWREADADAPTSIVTAGPERERRGAAPEPDRLAPFFGTRDLDLEQSRLEAALPALPRPPRPMTGPELEIHALATLDDALSVLGELFG